MSTSGIEPRINPLTAGTSWPQWRERCFRQNIRTCRSRLVTGFRPTCARHALIPLKAYVMVVSMWTINFAYIRGILPFYFGSKKCIPILTFLLKVRLLNIVLKKCTKVVKCCYNLWYFRKNTRTSPAGHGGRAAFRVNSKKYYNYSDIAVLSRIRDFWCR